MPTDELLVAGERHVALDDSRAHRRGCNVRLARVLRVVQRRAAMTQRKRRAADRSVDAGRQFALQGSVGETCHQRNRTCIGPRRDDFGGDRCPRGECGDEHDRITAHGGCPRQGAPMVARAGAENPGSRWLRGLVYSAAHTATGRQAWQRRCWASSAGRASTTCPASRTCASRLLRHPGANRPTRCASGRVGATEVVFLPRHGRGHRHPAARDQLPRQRRRAEAARRDGPGVVFGLRFVPGGAEPGHVRPGRQLRRSHRAPCQHVLRHRLRRARVVRPSGGTGAAGPHRARGAGRGDPLPAGRRGRLHGRPTVLDVAGIADVPASAATTSST